MLQRQTLRKLGPAYDAVDWDLAACRDSDADFFQDDMPGRASAAAVRECKSICAGCPIRPDCLRYAMATVEYGVWGGTTHEERRERRRRHLRLRLPAAS